MSNEINFDAEEASAVAQETEMTPTDFEGGNFLKNKPIGETLTFIVEKVVNNLNTNGTNKTTGKSFTIGLIDKNKKVRRIDLHTDQGIYTIGTWDVYFKLVGGKDSALMRYAANNNNSFKGAKVSITRNMNGQHASMDINDLSKIIGKSLEETKTYQAGIQLAMKEKRLYTVEVQ